MQKSYATSYVPFTLITVAPNTSNCAIFGSGAFSGTKITAGNPTAAAKHASDEAALPVDAAAMVLAWYSVAFITPTELARSLNDALGLRPSSLIYRSRTPTHSESRSAWYTGVQPICSAGSGSEKSTGSSSSYRQCHWARCA